MKTALVTKDNQGGLLIYLHLPELHDVNTLRSILFCSVYCGQVLKLQFQPFNDQLSPHLGTSQLVYRANQLIGYFMMGALALKWLKDIMASVSCR